MKLSALRAAVVLGAVGVLYACGTSSDTGVGDGGGEDGTASIDGGAGDTGAPTADASAGVDASDAATATDAGIDATPASDATIDSDASTDAASADTGGTLDAGADAEDASPADAGAPDASSADASDDAAADAAGADASDAGGTGLTCNSIVNLAPIVTVATVHAPAPVGTGGVFYPGTYYLTSATAYLPDGGAAPAETLQVTIQEDLSGGGGANWQYAYDWSRSTNGGPDDRADFFFNASGSTYYMMETCPVTAYPYGGSFTYDSSMGPLHLYYTPAGQTYMLEEVYTRQ